MRLGIISDTHGQVAATQAAVRMFESLEVERVLHCGDIDSAEVVDLFEPWPTDFVFGNVDDRERLRMAIDDAGKTCHDQFGDLTIEGVRIALIHSHEQRRFVATVGSGKYQVVCHGHTHKASVERRNDTLVINPGALYRATPLSVAVLDLPAIEATIVEL